MPFHAFTTPADYVGLFPAVRSYIYADADLVAGNVVLFSQYRGLIREKGSNRPDSPTTYGGTPTKDPDVAPFNRRWNGSNTFGTIGGNIYLTSGGFGQHRVAILNIDTNGYLHNDISVDVKTGDQSAGIISHCTGAAEVYVFLDGVSLRVKARTVFGTFPDTVLFTGTTPIVADTFYNLRTVEDANNVVSIYLNGVLEGTFDLTGVQLQGGVLASTVFGTGLGVDDTVPSLGRFKNFYVRPQGPMSATTLTVRNYDGDIVYSTSIAGLADPTQIAIPDSVLKQRSNRGPYGWYRVYLTGPDRGDGQWNDSYGDCSFIRIPASHLPANSTFSSEPLPPADEGDSRARSVIGMGTTRYSIQNSATPAAQVIADNLPRLIVGKTLITDTASPARPRPLLMAFPNGTIGNEANITAIVAGLKDYVKVWECRNEPNFTAAYYHPEDWVTQEYAPFYNAVKAGDPTAIVVGPGCVSFNDGGVPYFDHFLNEGNGGNFSDAFSLHAYNCYNGDLVLTRYTLNLVLIFMALHGKSAYDIWMTEQGYAWNYAGLVYPRYATRWTAMMYFGQEVITHGKMRPETTCYWYDYSIGFDTFPMYWLTPAGPGPTTAPIRTYSAEVWNKTFTSEFDFGDQVTVSGSIGQLRTGAYAQNLYLGGVWSGADGTKVAGLMAASAGANDVVLDVVGASTLTCVDPWGNTFTLTVSGGRVTFPISELPQWIRCPVGVTVTPVNMGLLTNIATSATVTSDGVPGSGNTGGTPYSQYSFTDTTLMNDGVFQNSQGGFGTEYRLVAPPLPVTVTLTWPSPVAINRVVVHGTPPWQVVGTPRALHIDTWDGATWTTRYTKTTSPVTSFPFTSAVARGTFETFFDEQYIFDAKFSPVTTSKVRIVITDTCTGSGEILGVYDALWWGWPGGTPQNVAIREIQAFAPSTLLPARGRNPAMGGVA